VALLSSGAAILLLCVARPELSERQPGWPVTLRLEPLGDDEVEELMAERIPGKLRQKIARAAGGNPLFIEEMLAMAAEAGGEVVTGTAERLATGDAVNVAARLEAAAEPGEVLIGQPTLALVREAVEVGPVQPLQLKGKAEPVPAYRLVTVHDAPERRHAARFVGRERELELVRGAWERVQAEQRCVLVTIIGDAGVGKSRLVGAPSGDRYEGTRSFRVADPDGRQVAIFFHYPA